MKSVIQNRKKEFCSIEDQQIANLPNLVKQAADNWIWNSHYWMSENRWSFFAYIIKLAKLNGNRLLMINGGEIWSYIDIKYYDQHSFICNNNMVRWTSKQRPLLKWFQFWGETFFIRQWLKFVTFICYFLVKLIWKLLP